MNGLLRQVEVCNRLGISDETWMRWRRLKKAGKANYQCVPDPVPSSPAVKKWRESDIEALLAGEFSPIAMPRRYFGTHRQRVA